VLPAVNIYNACYECEVLDSIVLESFTFISGMDHAFDWRVLCARSRQYNAYNNWKKLYKSRNEIFSFPFEKM